MKKFQIQLGLKEHEKVLYGKTSLKFFRIYADFIEAIMQTSLTFRQKDVLSGLLCLNSDLVEEYPDDDQRWDIILSKEYRDIIKGTYNLSDANFYNLVTSLKKKEIFVGNRIIRKLWIYLPEDSLDNIQIKIDVD